MHATMEMEPTVEVVVKIRWMVPSDLPAILAIDAENFDEDCRWDEDAFIQYLRGRNCIALVAECSCGCRAVYGYVLYELEQRRIVIESLAVAKRMHGHGIGRMMLDELKAKLRHNRRRLVAWTSERDVDSHLYFKACGFEAVEVGRDYIDDGEDGYKFVYRLPLSGRDRELDCNGK